MDPRIWIPIDIALLSEWYHETEQGSPRPDAESLRTYILSQLPHQPTYWQALGYVGDVEISSHITEQNAGVFDFAPEFLAWYDAQGFAPMFANYRGLTYFSLFDSHGAMVPGSDFLTSVDDSLLMVFAFILAAVVTGGVAAAGLGNASIGAAVLGPQTAAAYPALSSAITQVVVQSAVNGGDAEAAVKGALLSYAGSAAGSYAQGLTLDATQIDIAAKLAGSLTSAYVSGGNPKTAIQNTLLTYGASQFELSSPTANQGTIMDEFGNDASLLTGDPYMPAMPDQVAFDMGAMAVEAPFDPVPVDSFAEPQVFFEPQAPDVSYASAMPNLFPDTPAEMSTPASDPGFFDASSVIGGITKAASSALQLVAAYQKMKAPIQNTARRVTAGGNVQTVGSDGLVHTQTADGRVTSSKPPVGVASAALDGSLIVNNGDGTYTRISGAGAQTTQRYPATMAGMFGATGLPNFSAVPAWAWGLGALGLGYAFLKGNRR
jgi:hypothetical protein